jgi:hypothetical protein
MALSHLGGARAAAQDLAPLHGQVVDEATLEPIRGATVALGSSSQSAPTDVLGNFSVLGAPSGKHVLRVRAGGYVDVLEEIEIQSDASLFLSIQLARVDAVLSGLMVTARPAERSGTVERTAADMVASQVVGAMVTYRGAGQETRPFFMRGRGSMVLGGEPVVYLDGVRVGGTFSQALDILHQIPAAEVQQIQVLRGPATTTLSADSDGAILVTRRTGAGN